MKKTQNPADRFLILQFREGNKSVLPILVQRYHKIFCEKAYWMVKDKEIAKDIAQESWITIIDKLHTLEHIDSFKSWAHRIVYTKAIDRINKRNKQRKNEAIELIQTQESETTEDESTQIKLQLLQAIRQLPKDKQDIIRLFYTEEYSIKEISVFLGIPVGTVKSRLYKAREKLKSLLKKVNYEK